MRGVNNRLRNLERAQTAELKIEDLEEKVRELERKLTRGKSRCKMQIDNFNNWLTGPDNCKNGSD